MLIEKSRLLFLIKEAMLNEITLTSEPYAFSQPIELNIGGQARETFDSVYTYDFMSKDDLQYYVMIALVKGRSGQYFWDISFTTSSLTTELTDMNDIKIYTTVAHIIKDFVLNILDNLPDSDIRDFRFSGVKEPMHVAGAERSDAARVMSRRTTIYLKLLQRNMSQMLPGTEIIKSEKPEDENTVYFRVP